MGQIDRTVGQSFREDTQKFVHFVHLSEKPEKQGKEVDKHRTNPDKPGQGHAAHTSGTCVSSDMVDMVDMVDMTAGQIGKQNTPDTRIMSPLVTAKKPEKNAHSENRAAAGAAFYARNSHVAHT